MENTNMKGLKHYEIPKNTPVWAYACNINLDTIGSSLEHKSLFCKPVRGVIKDDGYFYQLRKDGKPYTNGVKDSSRLYTYEKYDCVQLFNQKIIEKQIFLRKQADSLNEYIVHE